MKPAAILNKYFNDGSYGRPKISLAEFSQEMKALSPEEKAELTALAAEQLGVEVG